MKKKKVLLLAPMSSVHERFNVVNIEVLKKMAVEIHLAANFQMSEHDQKYKDELVNHNIIVHDWSFARGSLIRNAPIILKLRQLLKQQQFDLVHCHTETGGIITRLAMVKNQNTTYLYTPHGMSFYIGSSWKSHFIYQPIEWWICRKMQCNIALNQEELSVLQHWNENTAFFVHGIGFDIDSINNAHPDIEALKSQLGIKKGKFVLLSVGELNENKNHEIVLRAISQLEEKDKMVYLICGEGRLRGKLKAIAKELNLEDNLLMPGFCYNMEEIYRIADVFVFPSYHEGLAVSMMQAMAVPLPVICSKIRGNVDMIEQNQGGILCDKDKVKDYSYAIKQLMEQPDLREKMCRINKENAINFSKPRVYEEIKKIYQGFLL